MTPRERELANSYLNRWLTKWQGNLPSWRYALLVAAAKSLALHPRDSAWGRSSLAKRGGKARACHVPYSRAYMASLGARGRERRKNLAEIRSLVSPDGTLRLKSKIPRFWR